MWPQCWDLYEPRGPAKGTSTKKKKGTGWMTEYCGSIPGWGRRFFLLLSVQTGPGGQATTYRMGTGSSFTGGSEADHSSPSSAEDMNAWSYASTVSYVFMAWCLIKHRDKFTFIVLVIVKDLLHKDGFSSDFLFMY
jgi:hypothetical protein